MLTQAENERLAQVGPGTPGGDLMRRYWQPVAPTVRLAGNPVLPVRILSEDLVLYRDKSGNLGLLQQRCPHRGVDLKFGIPTDDGLRCMYHGWLYDAEGRCLDQPLEPADSLFKDKIQAKAYPVQEMGGLVWAYLGPAPAPLLPRWDLFVWDNAFRHIGGVVLDANWLQCMENAVDTGHVEYLHGHLWDYVVFDRGNGTGDPQSDAVLRKNVDAFKRRHVRMEWDVIEYGMLKRRLREGDDPESDLGWTRGNPIIFPYMIRVGGPVRNEFQMRIPIDDTHTWHLDYMVYAPGPDVPVPQQDEVPYYDAPIFDEQGNAILDYVVAQDMAAWWSQLPIADRTIEQLGTSDRGVIMFRKMLGEQIQIVQDGGEPINTFRDPAANQSLAAPDTVRLGLIDDKGDGLSPIAQDAIYTRDHQIDRYSPVIDQVLDIYRRVDEQNALKR
ncbi:MAG: Rieske 2Fe-2S domain-containing protein [Dehalococcoidia bacterium]